MDAIDATLLVDIENRTPEPDGGPGPAKTR
jgi:hypothetical protein